MTEETQSESVDTSDSLLGESTQVVSAEQNENVWNYAEDMPGSGEKPDWFVDSKYKTVAEQAKGYNELRTKLGNFTGAPDGYEVNVAEDVGEIDVDRDHPLFKTLESWGKESNLSQDGFDNLLNLYLSFENDIQSQLNETIQSSQQEEIKKLGDDAEHRIKQIKDWASNNLNEEEIEAFKGMGQTAEQIEILEKLVNKSSYKSVPTDNIVKGRLGQHEIRELMKDQRYGRDMDFTKYVEKEAANTYG